MMRIVHLSVGDPFTARLANSQVEDGNEVHLIMLEPETDILKGVIKHYLPFKAPYGYYLNKFQLKKLLNKIKPDIFHVHYASGNGLLGRLASFKPSIISAWGSDVMVAPKKSKLMYWIVQKNLNYYDGIIATSIAMVNDMTATFKIKKKINQIPIGIDTSKFCTPSKKNKGTITIGTVKAMRKIYGIDTLINAFNLLINNSSKKVKLLIVGDGPDIDIYKNLVKQLNIQNLVEFTGYIKNKNIPDILKTIDIFVNLSRIESFGVAVLEASSVGIPVITSNIGGLPEVVINNDTGYLIPINDSISCAEKLKLLVDNAGLRKQMGDSGRKFVIKNYSWNITRQRINDLYSNIIKTNNDINH